MFAFFAFFRSGFPVILALVALLARPALCVNCSVSVILTDSYGDGNQGTGTVGTHALDPFLEGTSSIQGPFLLTSADR
jgi:hypothetical protein